MKLVKIVNYKKPWLSKVDGKEHPSTTLYLVFEVNGKEQYVAIEPRFKDNARDASILSIIAELKIVRSDDDTNTDKE